LDRGDSLSLLAGDIVGTSFAVNHLIKLRKLVSKLEFLGLLVVFLAV
jgi:hypothetical protein